MLAKALQGSTAAAQTYVDDVFSTYLYTGNGSTQTITNGIDLAGKGGLVWIKTRNNIQEHVLFDTLRGTSSALASNLTDAATTSFAPSNPISFNSDGFSISNITTGNIGKDATNVNGNIHASWTFRKAPKFFDVVTYTGNGTTQAINHSLGQTPGMIVVKAYSGANASSELWAVWHRSLTSGDRLSLNTTNAVVNTSAVSVFGDNTNVVAPTSSQFTIGSASLVNQSSSLYVAYLFAHDTAADGLIQCGSYTGNGNATGPTVTLGWEPQWLLIKKTTSPSAGWLMHDTMRGLTVGGNDFDLQCQSTQTEATNNYLTPLATGFSLVDGSGAVNENGAPYIYLAIRRPNKPPTSGTQVFRPSVYTGSNADNRRADTAIAPDMVWVRQRDDTVLGGMVVGDRLRGQPYLLTGSTAAEVNDANAFDQQLVSTTEYGTAFSAMDGFWCGNDATAKLNADTTANNHIALAFKRAPGFFDVVCYTGNGTSQNISHGLGVAPELIIVKNRSGSFNWGVYAQAIGASNTLALNVAAASAASTGWNSTAPTASVFSVNNGTNAVDKYTNVNAATYVAYLFASLPGISKVGTYTGNGSNQTINCGFSAGARFVLIKRTDSTGDWYVWRGSIVGGNDPHLSLNSTAAEVTTNDSIDPDNSGFVVNQLAATNINVSSATYIFLAIA